ncbi:MAG: hypothetical protein CL766_06540 [Chloroflexi bacterium]|nr:hypothetical protein [Chloroflexota bacterium]|tara:strand:+ start:6796 stop:7365 length:570 start_codon:yes stop_codon:yes gene_type:complete
MKLNSKNIFLCLIIGILILININLLNNSNELLANGRVKSYITKNTESYEILLGISPDPLQKGIGHIVIIVKDKTTQAFVNDANVTIKLNHRETSEIIGPLTLTNLSGLEPLSLNEYDIDLILTETGIWDLFIDIQRLEENSKVIHTIEVVKPNPLASIFGITILLLLVSILIFSIYSQIKNKHNKKIKK